MILVWRKLYEPAGVLLAPTIGGGLIHTLPEPVPFFLDDPFEDWRRCKPCGLQLLPEDQVRVIGYEAVLCFHCAMIALNLETLGPGVRMDVPLELLRRLRDSQVYDDEMRFYLIDGRIEG